MFAGWRMGGAQLQPPAPPFTMAKMVRRFGPNLTPWGALTCEA